MNWTPRQLVERASIRSGRSCCALGSGISQGTGRTKGLATCAAVAAGALSSVFRGNRPGVFATDQTGHRSHGATDPAGCQRQASVSRLGVAGLGWGRGRLGGRRLQAQRLPARHAARLTGPKARACCDPQQPSAARVLGRRAQPERVPRRQRADKKHKQQRPSSGERRWAGRRGWARGPHPTAS